MSVRRAISTFIVHRVAIRERDLVDDVAQQFRNSMRGSAANDRRELIERTKKLAESRRQEIERKL